MLYRWKLTMMPSEDSDMSWMSIVFEVIMTSITVKWNLKVTWKSYTECKSLTIFEYKWVRKWMNVPQLPTTRTSTRQLTSINWATRNRLITIHLLKTRCSSHKKIWIKDQIHGDRTSNNRLLILTHRTAVNSGQSTKRIRLKKRAAVVHLNPLPVTRS